MKRNIRVSLFSIIFILALLVIPFQIFAIDVIGTYEHRLSAGYAGENTKIELWGTGYQGYYKLLSLYNDNTSEQITSALTVGVNEDPWDLEINYNLPAGRYYYKISISEDYDIMNSEVYPISPIEGFPQTYYFNIIAKEIPIEKWVRTMPMTCWQVWINEEGNFQFIFWYPYKDKNWVRIYDMEGNMVYEVEVLLDDPNIIVDLPDGFYTVKTFHDQEMLQEFLIGKP